MVAEVILDFFTVLKVFFSFSGLVNEPIEKDLEGKVNRRQLEVDFVCNLGSARYYIQSAYSLPGFLFVSDLVIFNLAGIPDSTGNHKY